MVEPKREDEEHEEVEGDGRQMKEEKEETNKGRWRERERDESGVKRVQPEGPVGFCGALINLPQCDGNRRAKRGHVVVVVVVVVSCRPAKVANGALFSGRRTHGRAVCGPAVSLAAR